MADYKAKGCCVRPCATSSPSSANRRHQPRTRLHVSERGGGIGQSKAPVDHRTQPACSDGAVHRLESGAQPNGDPVHTEERAKQPASGECRVVAGDESHDADEAAERRGGQRSRKRRAARFDNDVGAAPVRSPFESTVAHRCRTRRPASMTRITRCIHFSFGPFSMMDFGLLCFDTPQLARCDRSAELSAELSPPQRHSSVNKATRHDGNSVCRTGSCTRPAEIGLCCRSVSSRNLPVSHAQPASRYEFDQRIAGGNSDRRPPAARRRRVGASR